MQSDVIIIGGGISGLIAAIELEQKGLSVTIIEQTDCLGGRLKTIEHEGLFFDVGFQVLLSAYPAVKKYINIEALVPTYFLPGATVYLNNKRYNFGDPLRNSSFLFPTLFAPLGSLTDKYKIYKLAKQLKKTSLKEIFDKPEKTTLAFLKEYGFSDKIIENFFRPFYTGIFLEPALQTSSRMFEFVFKMFAQGQAVLPANGIAAVVQQLQSKLQTTKIIYNQTVNEILQNKVHTTCNNTYQAKQIIVAAAAPIKIDNELLSLPNFKSCYNVYFNCEKNSLPKPIIGLIANPNAHINNICFLPNSNTVSVTIVKPIEASLIENTARKELKKYCNIYALKMIHLFEIKNALPNLSNLKYSADAGSIMFKHVILAGDHLANGSLNAAMLNGALAAELAVKNIK